MNQDDFVQFKTTSDKKPEGEYLRRIIREPSSNVHDNQLENTPSSINLRIKAKFPP